MAKTSLDRVQEAERTIFDGLYKRMDADTRLLYEDYVLTNGNGDKLPGQISVTMNEAIIYLNTVASWIMDAKWQTTVEGKISGKQQHLLENFLDDKQAQADECLSKTEFGKELPFLASHICGRGWIGARRLWRTNKDGNPYLEIVPIDMRYCSYERSKDGYNWVGLRWTRSRDAVKQDYGVDLRDNIAETDVIDVWDGEKEEVWIDDKIAKTNKSNLGYPPFVIVAAPEGFLFLDKGYMVRKGESIFFLDRKLYREWNRSISIDQSLAMMAIDPAYQRITNKGEPASPYPNEPGAVMDLPAPEQPGQDVKYNLIERPDINMANRVSHTEIGGAIQKGGVNNVDLGNLEAPTTAVLITTETELRNKILNPRLQAIEDYKVQSARMDIAQFQAGKFSGEIGQSGKAREYQAAQLGDPDTYTISYRGMTKSKKQEIANMALFGASQGLSLETRLKDILMVDDPRAEMAKINAEKAEQADPVLFYFTQARSLAIEAEDLDGAEADAKKLASKRMTKLGTDLIRQGNIPTPQAQPAKPQTNLGISLGAGVQ